MRTRLLHQKVANTGDFLRRCESILRRRENKSVASLPREESEQEKLARRIGAKDLKAFGEHYRSAREAIHRIYARYFGQIL